MYTLLQIIDERVASFTAWLIMSVNFVKSPEINLKLAFFLGNRILGAEDYDIVIGSLRLTKRVNIPTIKHALSTIYGQQQGHRNGPEYIPVIYQYHVSIFDQ